jgi:hypothetical protein
MKKDDPVFLYLQQKFPRLSEAKIKEGIFVGPQIRELTKNKTFDSILNEVELASCMSAAISWETIKQTTTRKSCKDFSSHVKQWGTMCH